jgi:hypothetical protein
LLQADASCPRKYASFLVSPFDKRTTTSVSKSGCFFEARNAACTQRALIFALNPLLTGPILAVCRTLLFSEAIVNRFALVEVFFLHLGSMRNEVAELWRGVKMGSMREKKIQQSGGE